MCEPDSGDAVRGRYGRMEGVIGQDGELGVDGSVQRRKFGGFCRALSWKEKLSGECSIGEARANDEDELCSRMEGIGVERNSSIL